jgi:hypothetical protein
MAPRSFNLRIEYCYRLSLTHKIKCRIILAGPVGSHEVAVIKDRLEDGVYFVPGQVGLPDLQCRFDETDARWDPRIDHPWHELEKINLTVKKPDQELGVTGPALVDAFGAVRWDDAYTPPGYPLKPAFEPVEATVGA